VVKAEENVNNKAPEPTPQPAPEPQPQPIPAAAPVYQQAPVYIEPDPYDHTAEFDPKDISDNKVIAMIVYLLGTMGIILALLAGNSSPYAAFHVRQALKYVVCTILVIIIGAVLCFTVIAPIAAFVCIGIISVLRIISFFQICQGKAREPYIICKFGFLR
jgi:hypothetical protein